MECVLSVYMFAAIQADPPNRVKIAPSAISPGAPAGADEGPPVQRLTADQIRSASAAWRARGRAGDEAASRVAEALEWLAQRRASEEGPKPMKALAGRISAWMGLGATRAH